VVFSNEIPVPEDICCMDVDMNGGLNLVDVTKMISIVSGTSTSPGQCPICTDSDNGINYGLKGTAKGILNGTNNYFELTDLCNVTNTNKLYEFYCSNTKIMFIGTSCAYGCSNGACKPKPVTCRIDPKTKKCFAAQA